MFIVQIKFSCIYTPSVFCFIGFIWCLSSNGMLGQCRPVRGPRLFVRLGEIFHSRDYLNKFFCSGRTLIISKYVVWPLISTDVIVPYNDYNVQWITYSWHIGYFFENFCAYYLLTVTDALTSGSIICMHCFVTPITMWNGYKIKIVY